MAVQRPNRLKEIALQQYQETPETLIPRILREEGSISGAAQRLGVNRNTVRYWINKLHIRVESHRTVEITAMPEKVVQS